MFLSYKPGTSVLSVDLTGKYIKMVQGSYKNEKLTVKNVFCSEINPEVFSDGSIKDKNKFISTITNTIKQNGLGAKEVVVTMDSSQLIRRELDVEVIPQAKFDDLVGFELSRLLPINIDEYIISYRLISEYDSIDGKKMKKVIVYAIPSIISKDLFMNLKECGLTPKAFDFNDNSLQKMMKFTDFSFLPEHSHAFIELQKGVVSIYIYSDGVLKLNRILDYQYKSMQEIEKQTREALGADADLIVEVLKNESWQDIVALCDDMNRHVDISSAKIPETMTTAKLFESGLTEDQGRFLDSIVREKNIIIEEIEKVFRFYTSRSGGFPIEKVLLYGEYAGEKDIAVRLSNLLNLPVEALEFNNSEKLNLGNHIKEAPTYVNAMGVMIRDYGKK